MYAIVDFRMPAEAVKTLHTFVDEVISFRTDGLVDEAICGHPDIFLYQDARQLIVAPNTPQEFLDRLGGLSIKYAFGKEPVDGTSLGQTVLFNCLTTDTHLFHKQGFTDNEILRVNTRKIFIDLPQSFTRCSLIALDNDHFITSDKGIETTLNQEGFRCLYVSPETIHIYGHEYGFVGGTQGRWGDRLFFTGHIDQYYCGEALRRFIEPLGIEIVNLYQGPLYDGGGIFFVE